MFPTLHLCFMSKFITTRTGSNTIYNVVLRSANNWIFPEFKTYLHHTTILAPPTTTTNTTAPPTTNTTTTPPTNATNTNPMCFAKFSVRATISLCPDNQSLPNTQHGCQKGRKKKDISQNWDLFLISGICIFHVAGRIS